MPGFKPPTQFPGMGSLPRPIRSLAEFAFPQTPDMPTPVATAVGGVTQVMPGPRDAIEMIKRLQGGLAKVPQAKAKMPTQAMGVPLTSARDIKPDVMDAMFRENNPVFRQMQAEGRFGSQAERSTGGLQQLKALFGY